MSARRTPISSLKSAIDLAAEMADSAPERYRQVAFQVVLDSLVKEGPENDGIQEEPNLEELVDSQARRPILEIKYDWSSTNIAKLKGTAQYLAVIRTALEYLNIDGLTAKQVQEILFRKFRISKTQSAVSMGLIDWVGKYIDRDRKGNENVYRITRAGIDYLKEQEAQLENE